MYEKKKITEKNKIKYKMEKQILAVVFKRNSYECICDDKQKTKKK